MTTEAPETSTSLGDYIRAARTAAQLSQEGLAILVGHSQAAVSTWEAGDSVPTARALNALARELPGAELTAMLQLIEARQ